MISEGVRLMVVGMSTVFAFLGLLVLVMHGAARALAHYPDPPGAAPESGPDDAEIAVVLAAAEAFRQQRGEG